MKAALIALLLVALVGCSSAPARLTVTSAWRDGAAIAPPYACTDEAHLGHSPPVSWSPGPSGTDSYAVTIVDTDANDFLHWGVLGLPTSTTSLPEGASPGGRLPAGAHELTNGYGRPGYGGPCPPPGKPHHYVLTVWAVHGDPAGYADLSGAAVATGTLTVTYRR